MDSSYSDSSFLDKDSWRLGSPNAAATDSRSWSSAVPVTTRPVIIPVTVSPGKIIRLEAILPDNSPEQGGKMAIIVTARDAAENRVDFDPSKITVACSAGEVSHLGNDTWELTVGESGTDHACTVKMDNLSAQRFFDVEAVLLGGSLGDTDAALSVIMLLMFLLLLHLMTLPKYL